MTSASNQLDAVAQLLQQTRTALQEAASGGSSPGQQQLLQLPGLLAESDALDELLFLTYLQAQYGNGGWSEAVSLFNQLQQVRLALCSFPVHKFSVYTLSTVYTSTCLGFFYVTSQEQR